jgi:carboxyl-terminal processing protease
MSRLAKRIVLSLSVVVFAYVAIGYVAGNTSDDKTYRSLTVFSEVLEHIQRDYVEDPNMRQVTAGALHGLADSLDPESSYLSPLEYADYRKKLDSKAPGEAGVKLSKRFGYIVVVSVSPDSPAQKAGLRNGDILESIAGFTTSQMAIGQGQILLTGQPGSSVKVQVIRRGRTETQEIDLAFAKLTPPRLLEDRIQGDIAYLRVPSFDAGTSKQIRDKVAQFDHQGAHKLILDLRECATGQVNEGISTAQLFLSSGTITTLRGQTVAVQTFSADPSKVVWKQPMTVLISNGTAGPAEVVAAAIAENHRGDTIGDDRTFGMASEQKLIQLDDGAALILTVANYYTPGGKSIPADGVAPTVPAQPSADDLAELNKQETPGTPPARTALADDPVVKKAIEILEAPGPQRKAA